MDHNVIQFQNKKAHRNESGYKQKPPPMLNIPPITKYLILGLLLIHAGISAIDQYLFPGLFDIFMINGGFIPAAWLGDEPFTGMSLLTPVSYGFLHGSWLHVLVNSLMLLTAGASLEKWVGGRYMMFIFFLSSLAAALAQCFLTPDMKEPIVGASGGISGLFGALLLNIQMTGHGNSHQGMWPIILVWIVISAVFGFLGSPDGMSVAWIAHIGGFLCGIALMKFMRQ